MCLLKAGLTCTGKQGMVGTKLVPMPHFFFKRRRWESRLFPELYFWSLEGLEALRCCGLEGHGKLSCEEHYSTRQLIRLGSSHLESQYPGS